LWNWDKLLIFNTPPSILGWFSGLHGKTGWFKKLTAFGWMAFDLVLIGKVSSNSH
jgi:hypothetical protein